jgi:hypothetical protein
MTRRRTDMYAREELCELLRAASPDGVAPTSSAWEADGRLPTLRVFTRAFGSWEEACVAAGIIGPRASARERREAKDSERLARNARREQRALEKRKEQERKQLAGAGERPLPRWKRERREAALERIRGEVESGKLVVRVATEADLRALDEARARRAGLPEPTPHELRLLQASEAHTGAQDDVAAEVAVR